MSGQGVTPYQLEEQRKRDKQTLTNTMYDAGSALEKIAEHAQRHSTGYGALGDTGTSEWYLKIAHSATDAAANLKTALRDAADAFGDEP